MTSEQRQSCHLQHEYQTTIALEGAVRTIISQLSIAGLHDVGGKTNCKQISRVEREKSKCQKNVQSPLRLFSSKLQ
jgi:hypothetical protein